MSESLEIPKKRVRGKLAIFGTGLLQVALVSTNTYQVAHSHIIGAIFVGFMISMVWTFNVRNVAFGTNWDRIIYALGASLGTGIGSVIGKLIYGE